MKNIVLSTLLLICTGQVLASQATGKSYEHYNLECTEKLKTDSDIVAKHFDASHHLPAGNEELTRVIECVGKESGLIFEDGTYNLPLLKNHVLRNLIPLVAEHTPKSEEIADKVVGECKHQTKGRDRIVSLHNCIVDAIRASF
ncbi:hypothetical protein RI129_009700 [Pyrocoelia pectoralis]|uniref:Uncharacterized protein n=1 Tax=Pyrocoelia pectoralis TaxID=417401 RepID=A0AAN7ZJ66_9COLE